MQLETIVPDPSRSVVHGIPLADEPGLGPLTLAGFLRDVTSRHAAREALVQTGADGRPERWSYADLWERSVAVARALVACGVGKGTRVGVLMTNRAEFLTSVFGTALAGGVAATISTFSTPNELEDLVALSGASVLLIEQSVLKKDFAQMLCDIDPAIAAAAPGDVASQRFPFLRHLGMVDGDAALGAIEPWAAFLARGEAVDPAQIDARAATVAPSDPGVLFFSSGSTGKPKGILSMHRGVTIQLWRWNRLMDYAPGDAIRAWSANGFFWSGNFAMIGGVIAAGGSLLLQPTFQPEQALALMAAERANTLFAWPHQWAQLEAAPNWLEVDLSAMRYVDADTPIARHPTVRTDWHEPRHAFGNTETFTLACCFPANTPADLAKGCSGIPLPGNTIRIVDPLGDIVVPIGQRGEIAVKGATLMLGYVGTPLDQTLDADGFLRTGDGGYVDADGRLFWEGRLNDIIKTGGANVSPIEIDTLLRDCPGVKLAQTVGVPHAQLGEIVVTCIVPHHGATLDEDAVRSFAKEKLASYKVPRRVLLFTEDEIALTGSNKIKASDLKARVAALLG